MKTVLRGTSIVLFATLSVLLIAFGALYASVQNLLWFHAAAVPSEALDAVKPIYFALMKLIGGASIGLGLLGAYTALFPIRQGVFLAATSLAVALAIPLAVAGYVAEHLRETTGAPTSWNIMLVLLAINLVAWLAHVVGRAK